MSKSMLIRLYCECGARIRVRAYSWVDLDAEPHIRAQLDKGYFHNTCCRRCKKRTQLEKWFLCKAAKGRLLVHVFPSNERYRFEELKRGLEPLHRLCGVETGGALQMAFGLSELLAILDGRSPLSVPLGGHFHPSPRHFPAIRH